MLVGPQDKSVHNRHHQDVDGDDVIPAPHHLIHPEGRDVQERQYHYNGVEENRKGTVVQYALH